MVREWGNQKKIQDLISAVPAGTSKLSIRPTRGDCRAPVSHDTHTGTFVADSRARFSFVRVARIRDCSDGTVAIFVLDARLLPLPNGSAGAVQVVALSH